jgi:hypothetical protein
MHYMALQSTMGETVKDLFRDSHLELQEHMRNPIAFHAEMMGDIMYLQQVLRQPDTKEFVQAVIKEVKGQVDSNNWTLKKRSEVPDDVQIMPSVWSLQCKRNLTTNKVKSHTVRLNLRSGKQVYGRNYFETYAPVVTWFAIRLMIIFSIIFSWALCQVAFVMAYPQAQIKMDIYMELPQGIQTAHGNSKNHVLKLGKNIYGQIQTGCEWNLYLVDELMSIGLIPSQIDGCMFFRNDIIFMVYVDDGIFLVSNDSQLQAVIKKIQALGLNIEDQGRPADYVGVNIKIQRDGLKPVPAKVSLWLHAFKDEPPFDLDFTIGLQLASSTT